MRGFAGSTEADSLDVFEGHYCQVLAGVPEEDREFVTGVWPPEFERILNGESASMLAQDARLGKL